MTRTWYFISIVFQTDSTKSNCNVCDINIGEEEDQLLNFEKDILKKEVSFFNQERKISMILLKA